MAQQDEDGGANAAGANDVQDQAGAATGAENAPAPVNSTGPFENSVGDSGFELADVPPWSWPSPATPVGKHDDDMPPPFITPMDPPINPSKG